MSTQKNKQKTAERKPVGANEIAMTTEAINEAIKAAGAAKVVVGTIEAKIPFAFVVNGKIKTRTEQVIKDMLASGKYIVNRRLYRQTDELGRVTRCQASDHFGDQFCQKFCIVDNNMPNKLTDGQKMAAAIKAKAIGLYDDVGIVGHSGSMVKDKRYYALLGDKDRMAHAEFYDWALCGLRFTKLGKALNKQFTYVGLTFSAAKPLYEYCGVELDIRDACVLDDEVVDIQMKADVINPDMSVNLGVDYTDRRKATDGQILYRVKGVATFQVRFAAIVKGLAVYEGCERIWTGHVKDIWGNDVDLSTRTIIIRKSAFKLGAPGKNVKEGGFFHSFEEFADAAVARGHRFYAARYFGKKPRIGRSSYQMLQTLTEMSGAELADIVAHEKEHLLKYTDVYEAYKLLPSNIGQVVKRWPKLMAIPEIRNMVEAAWLKKVESAYGGMIHDAGFYAPLTVDIRGVLPTNMVYCSDIPEGVEEVVLKRNPYLGPESGMVFKVMRTYPHGPKHTAVISANTEFWQRSNADIDGDTVFIEMMDAMRSALVATQEKLGCLPVVFPEGDGNSAPVTASAIRGYMLAKQYNSDEGGNVGIAVNEITNDLATGNYDRAKFAVLTYEANDAINSMAKHSSTATVNNDVGERREKMVAPYFRMWRKHPEKMDESTIQTGVVNEYIKALCKELPETLTIENIPSEMFEWAMPFGGLDKYMERWKPSLTKGWAKRFIIMGAKLGESSGVFGDLCFANAGEYDEITAKTALPDDWKVDRASVMRCALVDEIRRVNEELCENITLFDVMAVCWKAICDGKDMEADGKNRRIKTFLQGFFTAFSEEFCVLLDRYNIGIEVDDLDDLIDDVNADLEHFNIGDDCEADEEAAEE